MDTDGSGVNHPCPSMLSLVDHHLVNLVRNDAASKAVVLQKTIHPCLRFSLRFHGAVGQTEGSLKQNPRTLPARPQAFNGGGGLYSTTGDYVRFMQMILRRGRGPGKDQILEPKTVEMMASNHIGGLRAGILKTSQPERSSDLDLHPGATDKWGLGFLLNTTPYAG